MRTATWIVLTLGAALLVLNIGSLPLIDPDESRFARTSVEMLRTGDPVVPRFEGQPRLVKPPLIHWIQSSLFRLLGPRDWVARIHAVAATLGSLLLVGWVARRRFGEEAAVWAVAVLGTMPLVVALGHIGSLDALLAVHVWAAIALDLGPGSDEESDYPSLTLGGLLGLAFLVKGPVGVLLPLLVILAGRTAAGREILPTLRGLLRVVAAWSVVVLPWGLAFIGRLEGGSVWDTLRGEVLDRYFVGTVHVEPPWFYLKVAAVGFLPWMAPTVWALIRVAIERRQSHARTAFYVGAGLVAGLVFFSLSKGKVASYILPLAPLAALLVTWDLGQTLKRPRDRSWGSILLSATLTLLAIGLTWAAISRLDGTLRTVAVLGAVIYGLAGVVSLLGLLSSRHRVVYASAAGAAAAWMFVAVSILMPSLWQTRTAAYLVEQVPLLAASVERPIAVVDARVPSLTFYLDRVPERIDLVHLDDRVSRGDDPLFVFDKDDLARVEAATRNRLHEVGRQGKYVVLEKKRRR